MRLLMFTFTLILIYSCTCNVQEQDVDGFLDEWHKAAADADFDAYFSKMDSDAVYLGTQWDERWTKDEFAQFCKPYFEKGTTWDFKAIDRNYSFSGNKQYIWFDESLQTWMGLCRGSGVIRNYGDSLRLVQYNLAVTISNELVRDYVDLIMQDSINLFLLEDQHP